MAFLINIVLGALGVSTVLACGYLLYLTLLSARLPAPPRSSRSTRFDVIVPAHNESQVIERTVTSLLALDWPADRFRVIVVADNCTDTTAKQARERGATVLERTHDTLRGKGYALEFAFEHSVREGWAEAIVVVDADTEVSRNLLEAIGTRIDQGEQAVQVDYAVLNPLANWRTRLMTIAITAFHLVRSRARERLRVSCGFRGNGWCVTHKLLANVPYRAYSLAEDIEYGIALGLAGIRIAYSDESHVYGEMVTREAAARKQRERWERGRFELIASMTGPLLRASISKRSTVCLDLAMDLLVLPLSYVALATVALLVLAAGATWWDHRELPWLWVALGCLGGLFLYVLRGWQLSGVGMRGLLDLLRVPFFLLWKVALLLRRRESNAWVRTERERS